MSIYYLSNGKSDAIAVTCVRAFSLLERSPPTQHSLARVSQRVLHTVSRHQTELQKLLYVISWNFSCERSFGEFAQGIHFSRIEQRVWHCRPPNRRCPDYSIGSNAQARRRAARSLRQELKARYD